MDIRNHVGKFTPSESNTHLYVRINGQTDKDGTDHTSCLHTEIEALDVGG